MLEICEPKLPLGANETSLALEGEHFSRGAKGNLRSFDIIQNDKWWLISGPSKRYFRLLFGAFFLV